MGEEAQAEIGRGKVIASHLAINPLSAIATYLQMPTREEYQPRSSAHSKLIPATTKEQFPFFSRTLAENIPQQFVLGAMNAEVLVTYPQFNPFVAG